MCMILKTAASADYFGIEMKTAVLELLKLLLFEVAKNYGSHCEKTALNDFESFCLFFHNNWSFFVVINWTKVYNIRGYGGVQMYYIWPNSSHVA